MPGYWSVSAFRKKIFPMRKLSTLIVDDEAPARDLVRLLLQQYPFVELLGECADGQSAIERIRRDQPELVFLDIQMPGLSGFEVLRALADQELPYIIFTTAYDQYAIQAFEVNAVDYLLKPFTEERFRLAVHRARTAHEDQLARRWNQQMKALLETSPEPARPRYLQKISVRVNSRIRFIPVEEIIWISAENQYVRIHTATQTYLLRQSLSQLEADLSPENFYRTHRSSLVNIHAIRQIEPYFKGDYILYLQDGKQTKLSRKRAEGLRRILPW